jgi:hypothetical protein
MFFKNACLIERGKSAGGFGTIMCIGGKLSLLATLSRQAGLTWRVGEVLTGYLMNECLFVNLITINPAKLGKSEAGVTKYLYGALAKW